MSHSETGFKESAVTVPVPVWYTSMSDKYACLPVNAETSIDAFLLLAASIVH
jgi:hypothetical protein